MDIKKLCHIAILTKVINPSCIKPYLLGIDETQNKSQPNADKSND